MAADQLVVSRSEGKICYIGLNRPEKRNAINQPMAEALEGALAQAESREDAWAVILYGEGKVFSAGIDLMSLAAGGEELSRPQEFRIFVHRFQSVVNAIERMEKPVIAALHGHVLGLGLEIALGCDVRIATKSTQLGLPETRLGLIPDVGGTTRLTRTVGSARAKELIMTSRTIGAEEAERIGLVNRLAEDGEHLRTATEVAEEILKNAPLAVGLAKKIIDRGFGLDKMTFMEMEALAQSTLFLSEDFREAVAAALERREPVFKKR